MVDILEDLSDGESSLPNHQITINEHYAQAYAAKKEREEQSKLKDLYGSDIENLDELEDDDSESESEDEDGEELTPAVDAAILRTLSKIKKRDPEIYNPTKDVFQEEKQRTSASTPWGYKAPKEKSKPLTIKQQNMEVLLGNGSNSTEASPEPVLLTHAEEQNALRDETISAFHHAVSDNEDSEDEDIGGGLLTLREKTKDELEREEEDYRAYLEREVGSVKDLARLIDLPANTAVAADGDDAQAETDVKEAGPSNASPKGKKKKKSKRSQGQKEETDQEFLMNYILNRGWIDRESRHLPTYSEITGVPSKQPELSSATTAEEKVDKADGLPDLDELEEFEDVADHFESTYNFRFEEPNAAVIQRHPRNIESTVRREDTTRKEARERRNARKEEEIARKTEEVKRLKALKMREIRRKLDLVSKEGGIAPEELGELDLDGEWDPEKHDAQMASLYADDIVDPAEDLEKPVWNDDIDVSDIEPSERKSKKQKKKEERRKAKAAAEANEAAVDEDAMDADAVQPQQSYLDDNDDEEWDGTEEMRKRKLAEYMDDVYGLEFNDVIGGNLATRFKYTPVEKSAFQLTPAEILLATDAELNQYMGVKKYAPYRRGKERWDASKTERLKEIKDKVESRSWGGAWQVGRDADGDNGAGEKKKRKGKKERERAKMLGGSAQSGEDATGAAVGEKRVLADDGDGEGGSRKKKRRRKSTANEPST